MKLLMKYTFLWLIGGSGWSSSLFFPLIYVNFTKSGTLHSLHLAEVKAHRRGPKCTHQYLALIAAGRNWWWLILLVRKAIERTAKEEEVPRDERVSFWHSRGPMKSTFSKNRIFVSCGLAWSQDTMGQYFWSGMVNRLSGYSNSKMG